MPEPFRIGVVPGVTPDRWVRAWQERMPERPLTVVPVADPAAVAALDDGVAMVFARLPVDDDRLHVIPLWEETPVVVAGRDHPVKVVEAVTLAELADEDVRDGADEQLLDLVAAGQVLATMPQSVFRATGRRDVVARPITDAAPTRIGLVWRRDASEPGIEVFIGIVRGRTVNSSRGTAAAAAPKPPRRRRER